MAVRNSNFKYLDTPEPISINPMTAVLDCQLKQEPWLIDMNRDRDESYNVAMRYPEQAKSMQLKLDTKRREMDEKLTRLD